MAEEQKEPEKMADPKDLEANKGITFLSYIGLLCLIPLLTKKDSEFAQYHAKQGLVLIIGFLICTVLMVIPFLGWLVWIAAWITTVVLMITGLMNVSKGVMKPLPLVGQFAKKLKF